MTIDQLKDLFDKTLEVLAIYPEVAISIAAIVVGVFLLRKKPEPKKVEKK